MTDAEQQELFVRLERLERSNWRCKVLAVVLLLVLSLGAVSAVGVGLADIRDRAALRDAERARDEELEQWRSLAVELWRDEVAARRAAEQAPGRMPRADDP